MLEVNAHFKFLVWQELYEVEKPFLCFVDLPEGAEDTRDNNIVLEDRDTTVSDIRSVAHGFTLDDHGFMVRSCVSNVQDFGSTATIEQAYLPEIESLVRKEVEGVDRVWLFDWRLRRNLPDVDGEVIDLNDPQTWLRPVQYAHNDQSGSAVVDRIRRQLAGEADFLLKGRVRVINVWRPINHPVGDYPLAFCDGSTVQPSDLVEADHVRRHYVGSTLLATFNPKTKWYFLKDQRPDEVTFMKIFDSSKDVKASYCPHASFELPNIPSGTPPRESIEVRAMIFTYN